jgi:tRNA(adenine34) deaminase
MNSTDEIDAHWMRISLEEARRAFENDEVPVGACVVHEGQLIGKGYNLNKRLRDPTAHAEMIALSAAASTLGQRFLNGAILYVTLEPCLMCCGAIILARLERIVFGARDPKSGAVVSLYKVLSDDRLNHRVPFREGVRAPEAKKLLVDFFKRKR